MAKVSFVFNDETIVNSYGFMVANAGGKFERFRANPVMLHLHEQKSLIGSWENLRVEGSCLLADAVFDEADQFAKDIHGKVDRGFLKGASMGIVPYAVELKEVPGKGLTPVLMEWELLEGSTCPVPSNAMSLRLYNRSGEPMLSPDEIKLSLDNITKNKPIERKMEKLSLSAAAAAVLNIPAEPTMEALNAAIIKLSTERDQAATALSNYLKVQAEALVDKAISEGRLTADKKESFVKLATSDYKQASDLIEAMPAKQNLSGLVKPGSASGNASREDWNYLRWAKEDPTGLAKMQKEDPEQFAQLKANYKKA